jgi:uncharacterized Zn-binding protein involved in type VI secretion
MSIIATYSSGIYESTGFSTKEEILTSPVILYDNSANSIRARDVRDAVFSLWTKVEGAEVLATSSVQGDGIANYLPKWTSSNELSSTSSIYDSGSTVSIFGDFIIDNGTQQDGYYLTSDSSGKTTWTELVIDGNGVTAVGTASYLAKFTDTNILGNSILLDDGSTATVSGDLSMGGTINMNSRRIIFNDNTYVTGENSSRRIDFINNFSQGARYTISSNVHDFWHGTNSTDSKFSVTPFSGQITHREFPEGGGTYSMIVFPISLSQSIIYNLPKESGLIALGTGSVGYVPRWTSTSLLSTTSSIQDTGTAVSITGELTIDNGTQQDGYYLTSDSSGKTTWAELIIAGNGVTAIGTLNYISKFTDTNILGDSTITDDGSTVTINGNLHVTGTTSTVGTENLIVSDPIILLAASQSGSPTLDSGFFIQRGSGMTAGFIWDESNGEFSTIMTNDSATVSGNVNIDHYIGLRTATASVSYLWATSSTPGAIRINDTTQGTGRVLISNVDGVGTWQLPGTSSGVGTVNKFTATQSFDPGVTYSVVHALNTSSIMFNLWDDDTGELLIVDVKKTTGNTLNSVDVNSSLSISNGRIVIIG